MKKMRSNAMIKNGAFSILTQCMKLIFTFLCRGILIRYVGVEILGIDDVLIQMLQMLSLVELGVGNAITYQLYEPIHKNNTSNIIKIMQIYRLIYLIIGIVIFIFGIIFLPTIKFFINSTNFTYEYIYKIYILQLLASALSYFMSYRRNLIYAYQENYICSLCDMLCIFVGGITKIGLALYSFDYTYIVLVQVIQTLLSNWLVSMICIYKYPYLVKSNDTVPKKIDREQIGMILRDTKNVFISKIAGYVYVLTDKLVISYFLGVISVGLYSNYVTIAKSAGTLLTSMFSTILPTIGNYLCDNKDKIKNYELLKTYTFIRYIFASIWCCGIYVGLPNLISIWVGDEYILSNTLLLLIIIEMFIDITHSAIVDFIAALGLFKEERIASILCAISNIIFSVLFVKKIGIEGVLIGTCVSQIIVWYARYIVLFKSYFNEFHIGYWKLIARYILNFIITLIILVNFLKQFENSSPIIMLLISSISALVVSILSNIVFNFKTKEYKYTVNFIFDLIHKK